MSEPFDPYHTWLGIPPQEQPPHHYRLLGIDALEHREDVIAHAADRQMIYLRTFHSKTMPDVAERMLNEVAAARLCLLNADKKSLYDAQLRARLENHEAKGMATRFEVETDEKVEREPDVAVLGEYLLLDRVSSGGTGQVFKARHRTMGRTVALKILSEQARKSPRTVERFRRKVRVLSALDHPNIVAAYDAGERDGCFYLVMEFVDGVDLATLCQRRGTLSRADAVSYGLQAAAGLSYAHSQHVYHRNVKPSNLMIDRDGGVKVIGLGLARLAADTQSRNSDSRRLTQTGRAMGTLEYMAPEQAIDSQSVDRRADIYSLGCTLFAALAGRVPFPGRTTVEKVAAHREQPVPSLRSLRADVPESLDALLCRMMAKLPEERLQTMQEVIAALQRCG